MKLFIVKCKKNLNFIQGVDFDLIENLPNNGTQYLLKFVILLEKFQIPHKLLKLPLLETQWTEHILHQRQLVSSNQIKKRCRITKYTHSFVIVAEGCFTNQYIKSTTRSRISIERVVSRCNMCSLWSFTY